MARSSTTKSACVLCHRPFRQQEQSHAHTHRAQLPASLLPRRPQGWELRTFDIIGNLVLGLGVIIAVVSILGIFAGRTNSRTLLFLYFLSIMLVTYLLLLVVVLGLGLGLGLALGLGLGLGLGFGLAHPPSSSCSSPRAG